MRGPCPGVARQLFGGDPPGGDLPGYASGTPGYAFVTTLDRTRNLFRNSHLHQEKWLRFRHRTRAAPAMRGLRPGVTGRVFDGDPPGGSRPGNGSGRLRSAFVTTFPPLWNLFCNSHLHRKKWVRFLHRTWAARKTRDPDPGLTGRVLGAYLAASRTGRASGAYWNAFATTLHPTRNSFCHSHLYRKKWVRFLHRTWAARRRGWGPRPTRATGSRRFCRLELGESRSGGGGSMSAAWPGSPVSAGPAVGDPGRKVTAVLARESCAWRDECAQAYPAARGWAIANGSGVSGIVKGRPRNRRGALAGALMNSLDVV
jgi:hypothetical protein